MQLAWATDIHLDHLDTEALQGFCDSLAQHPAEAFVLTGDLSDAPHIQGHLEILADAVKRPVYFVLGNHDYYHGSIAKVRAQMQSLSSNHPYLRWLPTCDRIALSAHTALLGHDAWGDGGNGDLARSWVRLTDFRLIEEFVRAGEAGRPDLLAQLGQEAAEHLRKPLQETLNEFEAIVLLMHPPPLPEACLHHNQVADENWLPYFSCKAVGDLLHELLPQAPQCHLTVLAGHTHHFCDIQPLPNLRVCVGRAVYGQPTLAGSFVLP